MTCCTPDQLAALREARDPKTQTARLRELANKYSHEVEAYTYCYYDEHCANFLFGYEVREAVAMHHNADAELLATLADRFPAEVLMNPNTSRSVFRDLLPRFRRLDVWTEAMAVADERLTGDDFIALVRNRKDAARSLPLVERAVDAALAKTGSSDFAYFVNYGSEDVRWFIATNRLSSVLATKFSSDPAISVRAAVASNPATPVGIVTTLLTDKSPKVRKAALENSSIPLSEILALAADRASKNLAPNAAVTAREADIRAWVAKTYPELTLFAPTVSLKALMEFVIAVPRAPLN